MSKLVHQIAPLAVALAACVTEAALAADDKSNQQGMSGMGGMSGDKAQGKEK